MIRIAALLASTALLAGPALAADVIYEEPVAPIVVEEVTSWTGFYLGGQFGGAFNPKNPDQISIVPSFGGAPAGTIARAFGSSFNQSFDSSFIGGAHVGYDYQINNVVLGGIVDINALDVMSRSVASSSTPAFYNSERSLDYLVTARLRAGYLFTPTFLAYATGGLAYGEVDYGFQTNSPAVTAAFPALNNEDEDEFGYTVGGGVEVLVTDNISVGGEYLYTNLGGGDSFTRLGGGVFNGGQPGGFTDFRTNGDFDFHTVTAKISYRFN